MRETVIEGLFGNPNILKKINGCNKREIPGYNQLIHVSVKLPFSALLLQ